MVFVKRGHTVDDVNPASANICHTTIIPRVLVHFGI